MSILAECEEDVGDGDNNLVTVDLYKLINTKTSVSRRKDNKVKVSLFYYDSIFPEGCMIIGNSKSHSGIINSDSEKS